MRNLRLNVLNWAVIIILVSLPVLLMLKFLFGFPVSFLTFKNKPLMYGLFVLWNASFAHFLFKIL
jgi:hypothetical protein